MGISWLTVDDYEADDIVATLSARGEAEGMNVFIASGDKDSYQLVSDLTSVVYPMPRSQMLLLNPAGVEERTGVRPDQYSDLAALVGEKADNLPGVPGVGPKTAAKWLNQYGGLGQLLDHAEEIKGKAGQSLRDNIEQVRLNRVLNKLVRDLDIVPNLDQLVPMGVERQALHELFDTLDFTTLRTRVLAELPIREGSEDVVEEADKPEARDVTLWEGSCGAFLAEHAGPYAIAIEGNGKPGAGSVARFACAARDGYVFGGEPALISEEDSAAFSALLSDPNVGKIGHSMKVQIHAWLGRGTLWLGSLAIRKSTHTFTP